MEAVLVKWNVARPELRKFLPRMSSIITHVAVSTGNTQVAVCTGDNGVHLISVDGVIKCTIQEFTYIMDDKTGNDKFPVGLRLDPRTNTLALNGRTGHLQFYSAYTNNLLYNVSCKTVHSLLRTKIIFVSFLFRWILSLKISYQWKRQKFFITYASPRLRLILIGWLLVKFIMIKNICQNCV